MLAWNVAKEDEFLEPFVEHHSGEGLAPAAGVLPQLFKVLLEREIGQMIVAARGGELCHRGDHGLCL